MSTDFPTAPVGSSQAPTAAVEKSLSASHTKIRTLPGRYPNTSRLYGELRNWAYVFPAGWRENVPNFTVVDHLIGFGGPLSWKELATVLHQPIKNRSQIGKPFSLSSIGPIFEQLRYVSPGTARRAIEEIAKVESLEIAWVSGHPISAFLG